MFAGRELRYFLELGVARKAGQIRGMLETFFLEIELDQPEVGGKSSVE